MRIRPLYDEVIVRLDATDERTAAGLHIPEMARKKTRFASVLAVGPGLVFRNGRPITMGVKAGDRVLLRELFEDDADLKRYRDDAGDLLHIFREDDVLAVVES